MIDRTFALLLLAVFAIAIFAFFTAPISHHLFASVNPFEPLNSALAGSRP